MTIQARGLSRRRTWSKLEWVVLSSIYKRDTLKRSLWQTEIDGHNIAPSPHRGPASSAVISAGRDVLAREGLAGAGGFEAAADMRKKLDREYRTSITDVDTKTSAWIDRCWRTNTGWRGPAFAAEAGRHPLHATSTVLLS